MWCLETDVESWLTPEPSNTSQSRQTPPAWGVQSTATKLSSPTPNAISRHTSEKPDFPPPEGPDSLDAKSCTAPAQGRRLPAKEENIEEENNSTPRRSDRVALRQGIQASLLTLVPESPSSKDFALGSLDRVPRASSAEFRAGSEEFAHDDSAETSEYELSLSGSPSEYSAFGDRSEGSPDPGSAASSAEFEYEDEEMDDEEDEETVEERMTDEEMSDAPTFQDSPTPSPKSPAYSGFATRPYNPASRESTGSVIRVLPRRANESEAAAETSERGTSTQPSERAKDPADDSGSFNRHSEIAEYPPPESEPLTRDQVD